MAKKTIKANKPLLHRCIHEVFPAARENKPASGEYIINIVGSHTIVSQFSKTLNRLLNIFQDRIEQK